MTDHAGPERALVSFASEREGETIRALWASFLTARDRLALAFVLFGDRHGLNAADELVEVKDEGVIVRAK